MRTYKSGDFAKIQGQLVEIMDVKIDEKSISYKIRLVKWKNRLTNWIDAINLEPISSQVAPKVLYGTKTRS